VSVCVLCLSVVVCDGCVMNECFVSVCLYVWFDGECVCVVCV